MMVKREGDRDEGGDDGERGVQGLITKNMY